MFVPCKPFQPGLRFLVRPEPTIVKHISCLQEPTLEGRLQARVFAPVKPFRPGLMFLVRPEPTVVKHFSGAPL